MNALEKFRVDRKLSFQALAVILGVDKRRAFQWCRGVRVLPAERVPGVSKATGIARVALRPDLYDERVANTPPPMLSSEAIPC